MCYIYTPPDNLLHGREFFHIIPGPSVSVGDRIDQSPGKPQWLVLCIEEKHSPLGIL